MSLLKPELVQVDGFSVIGIQTRTKNVDELNPNTAKLHQLWEKFFKMEMPNYNPASPIYGVYSDYVSDCNDYYTVTASVELNADKVADNQFNAVNVKSGNYLVFKNSGPIPQAIYEAWEAIWAYFKSNPDVVRTYDTDFELCAEPEKCAIYIGVRK